MLSLLLALVSLVVWGLLAFGLGPQPGVVHLLLALGTTPLLGLTPNSVSATAYRAREGLRKAYLQAHVTHNPPERCRAAAGALVGPPCLGCSTPKNAC